ncbi:MAG: EVE domain-containing protein [Candidatus Doudnabacteria bacterium]|nr:EVE domain-containing protein [Candidatus Doudnabacteria bacterium]
MKKYWLIKSEPDSYSIDDLKKDKSTLWENIRNYRARNIMRDEMQPGDLVFFYHSMAKLTGIAGIGKVVQVGLPDDSALDKKSEYYDPKATKDKNPWVAPKIGFVSKFKQVVTLEQIKNNKKLSGMSLFRVPRLSVHPITKSEFEIIKNLGEK